MDTSLWQRLDGYLDHALELEPAEREPWLASLATTEPELATHLGDLLAERDALNAAGFLEGSPLSSARRAATPASMSGQQVGAYRIERLLGRGGMGEVWLASRSDGRFEGRYAIKVLDCELVQPRLVERFLHEGRLLARLTHPNIARLTDAGVTSTGQPYLILEHIVGASIDRHCDERLL
ncbi:MAG TPA: protein kinase, partial [Povalibacter sp.]|nr:protein kinase [Povalibacter sp.]